MDIYPVSRRRPARGAVPALGCSHTALCRDECGDPRLEGKNGHVYPVCGSLDEPTKPGFQFFVSCETGMAWTYAKKALKFAGEPTNDWRHIEREPPV